MEFFVIVNTFFIVVNIIVNIAYISELYRF